MQIVIIILEVSMEISRNVMDIVKETPGLLNSIQSNRSKFISIVNTISRPGISEFLEWLDCSDFFYAPASTKYHLSRPGGLCEHSLNVYEVLNGLYPTADQSFKQTLALVSLFHDVCKVNYYTIALRNTKDSTGNWVKVPYYTVDDKFPYGHGEKSAHIVSSVIKLSTEELMAIRWHMGGFESGKVDTLSSAFSKYQLAVSLHAADLLATYTRE